MSVPDPSGGGAAEEPPTLYLDVDGVLRTEADVDASGRPALAAAAVGLVAGLVRDLGARVVVSSTWRVEDCRPTLVGAGLPEGCFHPDWRTRVTPASLDPSTGLMLPAERADRGGEVSEHARRNGVTRYVVIDDADAGPEHRGRQVRPDPAVGLTREGAEAARAIARMAGRRRSRHLRR